MNRCKIFYLFIYNHEVLRLEKVSERISRVPDTVTKPKLNVHPTKTSHSLVSLHCPLTRMKLKISSVVRKPDFCICLNKGEDQLISAFAFAT